MATVRIFLLTFRRPALLRRALASLRSQTLTDWACEVHNNDPADPAPAEIVSPLGDARIRVVLPEGRVGAVEAFNRAHRRVAEPYQSILEDDNWWEPRFLEKMLAALERRPSVDLAWANMKIWEEQPDRSWRDTGASIWDLPADSPPRLCPWPQLLQFSDCLYSNGAMLLRSAAAERLIIPSDVPFDMMEQLRERQMRFPILLVPEVLANYALTVATARTTDYHGWGEAQALLGAAFLAGVPMSPGARRELWRDRRRQRPRATNPLLFSGLLQRDLGFLRGASALDWIVFLRGCARRPGTAWRILTAKRRRPGVWRHLCQQTAARTAEARAGGFTILRADTIVAKAGPGAPQAP